MVSSKANLGSRILLPVQDADVADVTSTSALHRLEKWLFNSMVSS